MEWMRKLLVGCVFATCLCGINAVAQTSVTLGELQPLSVQMETQAEQYTFLKVKLELNMDSLRLGRKQARVFTPVLSDGKHKQSLRPIIVNGSWRHLMYKRSLNKKENGLIVRCGRDGAGMVEYVDSCIYSSWMKEAKLWLAEDLCGCGGEVILALRALPAQEVKIEVADDKPVEQKKPVLHRVATLSLDSLTFPINRTEILPEFGKNRTELKKLTNMLDTLLALPGAQVDLVSMTGYASPEGPYSNNERLAYGRTIALKEYLQQMNQYRTLPFRAASVAEDWEGLEKALRQSDMPYRTELLLIIATKLSPDEKEDRMRFLDRGSAYKILKRDFLPQLRRTVCEIHYTVRENDE